MSASPAPVPHDLDSTMGALLIGAFVSCLLLGVTSVQLYFYWTHFPRDNILTKLFVFFIWVMDTLQTGFQCHALYHYLITHRDDPVILLNGIWTLDSTALMEAFIGGPIEIFFAMRVWKLSQGSLYGRILTIVIIALSVLHSGFSIAFSIKSMQHTEFTWWPAHILWVNITGFSLAAIADVLIAAAVSTLLWQQSARTVFRESRTLAHRLIRYSVETGALTSAWAIVIVVFYSALSRNLIWLGMLFVLPKLYANSLMAMLNSRLSSRKSLQGQRGAPSSLRRTSGMQFTPTKEQFGGAHGLQSGSETATAVNTPGREEFPYGLDSKANLPLTPITVKEAYAV